jgi:hypothetical protein
MNSYSMVRCNFVLDYFTKQSKYSRTYISTNEIQMVGHASTDSWRQNN